MKNNKVPNDGLLRTNYTKYSRYIVGKQSLYVLVILGLVFSSVPWDKFHQFYWFREFITMMSYVSPNINEIPDILTNYAVFAISFVGVINLLGPVYIIIAIYAARQHMKKLLLDKIGMSLSRIKLIWSLAFFIIMGVFLLYFSYTFAGVSSLFPGAYDNDKWRFVFAIVMCWWGASFLFFGAVSIFIYLNKQRDGD